MARKVRAEYDVTRLNMIDKTLIITIIRIRSAEGEGSREVVIVSTANPFPRVERVTEDQTIRRSAVRSCS